VAKIARPDVRRAIAPIVEVTTADHSKRTDGREDSRFGAAQAVFLVTVAHDLAVGSMRQIQVTRERVACVISVARVMVPLAPSRIVAIA
jgi:hypothetical protein